MRAIIFLEVIELAAIALLAVRSFNHGKRVDRLERFSSDIINERMSFNNQFEDIVDGDVKEVRDEL